MAYEGRHSAEVVEWYRKVLGYDLSVEKSGSRDKLKKSTHGLYRKHENYSTNGVHELLRCPACNDLMYPPILQCSNGHPLCAVCKIKLRDCCPTCHFDLVNIRCLSLEKIAETFELPCKYQSVGCRDVSPYYNMVIHEHNCQFRPYNCPYAGSDCSVIGDIPTLVAHLKDDHRIDMHDGCTFNHRYIKSNPNQQEFENDTWMLTGFNCFGRHFCLHFEGFRLGEAPVYIAFLRFMGEDDEAKKFSYTLEVGANGRKLTWQGVPRSIRDSPKKVRRSHDGLIIQRNMAMHFSGGDKQELKLGVIGRIWKED